MSDAELNPMVAIKRNATKLLYYIKYKLRIFSILNPYL